MRQAEKLLDEIEQGQKTAKQATEELGHKPDEQVVADAYANTFRDMEAITKEGLPVTKGGLLTFFGIKQKQK